MKNKKWLQLIILLAIVVVGVWTISDSLFNKEEKPPTVGDQALEFSVMGLDGETYRLSQFRGQPVVVNFWGTFCEPCVRETPMIESYYKKYGNDGEGLVVLGVNLDEAVVSVRSFVKEYEMTYPVLLDKSVIRRQYGVRNYPTTFFIDDEGVVIRILEGEMTETMMDAALTAIGVTL